MMQEVKPQAITVIRTECPACGDKIYPSTWDADDMTGPVQIMGVDDVIDVHVFCESCKKAIKAQIEMVIGEFTEDTEDAADLISCYLEQTGGNPAMQAYLHSIHRFPTEG